MKFRTPDELTEKIAELCEGLVYISETDSAVTVYEGDDKTIDREYAAAVKKNDEIYRKGSVEISGHEGLFDRLTAKKDWHTTEQKQRVKKFERLRKVLETNLTDLRLIRKGKVQVDIYIVGADAENNLFGIKTHAVET